MQKLQFQIDSGFIQRLKWNRFSLNTSFSYQLFGVYCERPWISDTWKIPKIPIFPLFSIVHKKESPNVLIVSKTAQKEIFICGELARNWNSTGGWGIAEAEWWKKLGLFFCVLSGIFDINMIWEYLNVYFTFKKINLLIFSNSIQLLY